MAATKRRASGVQLNRSEPFSLPAVTFDGRQIRFLLMDQNNTFHISRDLYKACCQPLFLGSDVLAGIKQDTKNHHRVHARFTSHGLATKLILTDVRIEGTPNCGSVYFYSILGMFQAVFEYHPLSVQRHCLENFTDIWLRVSGEAPLLEETYSVSPTNLVPSIPHVLHLQDTHLENCTPTDTIPELSVLDEDVHLCNNPFGPSAPSTLLNGECTGAKRVRSEVTDSSQGQNVCGRVESDFCAPGCNSSLPQRFASDSCSELTASHLQFGVRRKTAQGNESRDRATSETCFDVQFDVTRDNGQTDACVSSSTRSYEMPLIASRVKVEREDEYHHHHPSSKFFKSCCKHCSPVYSVMNDISDAGSFSLSDLVQRWLEFLQSLNKAFECDCQTRQSSESRTDDDSFEKRDSAGPHVGAKYKPGTHNSIQQCCGSQHEVLTTTTLPYTDAVLMQLQFAELVLDFMQHSLQFVTSSTELPIISKLLSLVVLSLSDAHSEDSVLDEWSCLTPGKSAALTTFSHWLGEEFHRLEPSIARRVTAFKEAHIENICNLPSAEEVVRELFPPCMVELARTWTGLQELQTTDTLYMDHSYEHGCKVKERSRTENRNLFPIIQLVLELANNTLVSGVAHVVYCQLRHVT